MVRWADGVTGLQLNTLFDAEGNRVRAFTDTGFDPLGQNTDGNPNFRYVNHVYTFDAARRVTREVQATMDALGNPGETLISSFGYDAANNRVTWNNAGTVVTYVYDANSRAVQGDFSAGGTATHQAWTYDAMGNVLTFRTLENGSQKSATTNTYNDANRTLSTTSETAGKDTSVSTNTYDRSLRITQSTLHQGSKTYYYTHNYFGDGREQSIRAAGDAFGNSTSTYDANKIRSSVNLGQGDGQDRAEVKTFTADNEGHLVSQFHDDGKSDTREVREYLYANGNPWGETGNGVDGVKQVFLDSGKYSLIQNLGDTFPGGVLTYTTREGDSLMAIASQMYGNPSLWFVIADANGLNAGDRIPAGRTLTIPNSVKTGHITAENHRVYSESEIVGSTLPNLKTPPPPPPKKGCGSIIMIIIIVVIAIVVSVVTAGIAAPLAAAAVGAVGATAGTLAAFVVTAAVYAAVGAVVAAIGSIIQQGLFIALGYQESFSWKQVGTAAITGALSGAASGVGAAAQAAAAAGKLTSAAATYAQIASAALKASSAAAQQLLTSGKITSWTSLASAAIGGYAEAGGAIAKGADVAANAAKTSEALSLAQQVRQAATAYSDVLSNINTYVTPWAQLAETYIRNDGKLTPTDWATAAGSTLAAAVSDKFGAKGDDASEVAGRLRNGALRLASNAVVAGVLSHYDKNAAESYFYDAVGHEVGQFIGDSIGGYLKENLFPDPKQPPQTRFFDPTKNGYVDKATGQLIHLPSENALIYQANGSGQMVDQYGNPAPIMYASSGQIATDAIYDDASDEALDQDLNQTAAPDPAAPGSANADYATPNDTGPATRTVRRGDNLSKIAKEVYGDPDMWPLIAAVNGIERPDMITPGQSLILPPAEGIDARLVHKVAGEFYTAKEQLRQAREEAMGAALVTASASSATAPSAPGPREETYYDPMTGLPMGTITVNDNGFQPPREGLAGNVAGAVAGTGRFLKNTVVGLWDLGKAAYQTYDYALTGNPASLEGYKKMEAIGDAAVSLVSDSIDTYAYLATGDAKYKAGFDANAARGDAVIAAAEGWKQRYGAADDYEKSAMIAELVDNIGFAVVGTKGMGSTKVAGESAALTELAGGAGALRKAEQAAALSQAGRVEAMVGAVAREGAVEAGEAGSFASLKARSVTGDILEVHHMPQAAAEFTSRAEGGALVLEREEHLATRTFGYKGALTAEAEAGLPFRQVLARDIRDVRSIVGTKYNQGLRDLVDYYRQNFPELIRKP